MTWHDIDWCNNNNNIGYSIGSNWLQYRACPRECEERNQGCWRSESIIEEGIDTQMHIGTRGINCNQQPTTTTPTTGPPPMISLYAYEWNICNRFSSRYGLWLNMTIVVAVISVPPSLPLLLLSSCRIKQSRKFFSSLPPSIELIGLHHQWHRIHITSHHSSLHNMHRVWFVYSSYLAALALG